MFQSIFHAIVYLDTLCTQVQNTMLVDPVLSFMRKPSNSRNSHLVFKKHITYNISSYFSWKTVIREKVESPSQGFIMLIVHLCQSFKANIPSIFLHNLRLSPVRFQNFHKIDLKLGMDICLTYLSTFHRSLTISQRSSDRGRILRDQLIQLHGVFPPVSDCWL